MKKPKKNWPKEQRKRLLKGFNLQVKAGMGDLGSIHEVGKWLSGKG